MAGLRRIQPLDTSSGHTLHETNLEFFVYSSVDSVYSSVWISGVSPQTSD